MKHILKPIVIISMNYQTQSINQNQPPSNTETHKVTPTHPPAQPRITSSEPPPSNTTTPPTTQSQVTSSETSPPTQVTDPGLAIQPGSPFPISYILYAVLAGVLISFFWPGWGEWLKRRKKTPLPAEAEKLVCPTCGGSGKITKKRKVSAPCLHCKKTGIDICHYCGGTGRNGLGYGVPLEDIENYPKCDYCGGKGSPEIVLPCCMCKGKRKIESEVSYEETCPTCKGSGWIRNW